MTKNFKNAPIVFLPKQTLKTWQCQENYSTQRSHTLQWCALNGLATWQILQILSVWSRFCYSTFDIKLSEYSTVLFTVSDLLQAML